MASSREKLRAMSKKNLADQKQVENQPTLVSNMVNQLNKTNAVQTTTKQDTVSHISEKKEQEETLKLPQAELKVSNELGNTKEQAVIDEQETPNDASETVETHKKPTVSPRDIAPISQSAEKYSGKEVTITLLLSEEIEEYLTFTALELRVPVKKLFKELMINEIEHGTLIEDELTKAYRKVRHNTVKKSIPVNEDLKAAIKETAIKYHMRYTSFMTYVIDKARKRDVNKPHP